MQDLYDLICKVKSDETIETAEYLSRENKLVSEIGYKLTCLLVTNSGLCNWANIDWLEEKGIRVFPVERDSFGWVIGGISTEKGVITYG